MITKLNHSQAQLESGLIVAVLTIQDQGRQSVADVAELPTPVTVF